MKRLALLAALATAGCYVEGTPDQGDATFVWSFEGTPNCFQAGVSTVEVYVSDFDGYTVASSELTCSDGSVSYLDLGAGTYSFDLVGLASDGTALYEGGGDATVQPGSNTYTVNLQIAQ